MCLCRSALKLPPLGPNPQGVVMASPRKMWEDKTGGDWCPASHTKCWEEWPSGVPPHQHRIAIAKWERQRRCRKQGSEADPLHADAMVSLLHLQHLKEALSDQGLDHSAELQRRKRASPSGGSRVGSHRQRSDGKSWISRAQQPAAGVESDEVNRRES